MVILDVGANVGQAALTYRNLYPDAQIHSFEPFPESFDKLNVIAGKDAKLKAWPLALGDVPGKKVLHTTPFSDTNSLLAPEKQAGRWVRGKGFFDKTGEVEITVDTLDSWATRESVLTADIMKVDVQGAENLVLKGGMEFLSKHSTALVALEVNLTPLYEGQASMAELLQLMETLGYSLFDIFHPKRFENGRLMWFDLLFYSPKRLPELE